MAAQSVFLPGNPWTQEPGGPRSTGRKEWDTTELDSTHSVLHTNNLYS